MSNIAETIELARDIGSLVKDCEIIAQAIAERDGVQGVSVLNTLWVYAVRICNADDFVSDREALYVCRVFADLMPHFQLKRYDLKRAARLLQESYTSIPPQIKNSFFCPIWSYLARYDELHATGFATRYSEVVVRMGKVLANAEGVRNERKLAFVAQIENALTPTFGAAPRDLAVDIRTLICDCEPLIARYAKDVARHASLSLKF